MKLALEFDRLSQPFLNEALLTLAKKFEQVALCDSQGYADPYGTYELLAAFGAKRILNPSEQHFAQLADFHRENPSWLFGYFNFDLKNSLEALESRKEQKFNFGDLYFFEPEMLFQQKRGSQLVQVFLNEGVGNSFLDSFHTACREAKATNYKFPYMQARMTKKSYLEAIASLKKEIQYGNIYEVNYCQEFYAESCDFDPYLGALALKKKSPVPFSSFFKQESEYLLCASPERFLKKTGAKLISQPIKGTAKRGLNKKEDEALKVQLAEDLKEQTENVMIVDLVRNDLSRTAQKASVEVEELFGVYTFPQVHQLISTISSRLREELNFSDAIEQAFPMGSMTGAPKVSALKLIEKHEQSRRELYSGAVGYISPEADFDFNVVIRSLLYSTKSKYLSLTVGGAITSLADPEREYEECLLKAKAIFDQRNEK